MLLAACSDNATKQESVQIFAAASSVLGSAQIKAVGEARATQLTAPAELTIDFSGPCLFGGTVALTGTYAGDGDDDRAVFDLDATFDHCKDIGGTLDGGLAWTSEATSAGFAATLDGGLDWDGNDGSASCTFDLALEVGESGVVYGGHLCGYDVRAELALGH